MDLMKKSIFIVVLLFLTCAMPCFPSSHATKEVSGLPFIINNGQYGLYYGLIGKVSGLAGVDGSVTTSIFMDQNGGNGMSFLLSAPDASLRIGKAYGMAFDVSGSFGRTIKEDFYGIGNDTSNFEPSYFNRHYGKYNLAVSHAFNEDIIIEGDMFFANHRLYDIVERSGTPSLPKLNRASAIMRAPE
jgi:hypothetical protein